MNARLKEARTFTIALCLSLEIEDLDGRIKFEDADVERVSCLNDIIDLTERRIAALSNQRGSKEVAADLVQRAAAKVFPYGALPEGNISLADAFSGLPFSPTT